jgi:hypothetical protein
MKEQPSIPADQTSVLGPGLPDLFDLDPAGPVWRHEDLSGLLQHQLASELEPALAPLHDSAGKLLAIDRSIRTFGDLLTATNPPVGLLRLAKRFFKIRRHGGSGSAVPPEVDKLLYAAAVVAARSRCNQKISELPDDVFAGNVCWAIEQPWATDELRKMMREWLAAHGVPK